MPQLMRRESHVSAVLGATRSAERSASRLSFRPVRRAAAASEPAEAAPMPWMPDLDAAALSAALAEPTGRLSSEYWELV
jgi:hypothetical protein